MRNSYRNRVVVLSTLSVLTNIASTFYLEDVFRKLEMKYFANVSDYDLDNFESQYHMRK